MSYFTILHWISIVFFILLFILLTIISIKEDNKKILFSMIFSSFLLCVSIGFFSMLIIDKYTKMAELLETNHTRVLSNETIVVSGRVKNTGSFDIGRCEIVIKIVNNPIKGGSLRGSDVFNPKTSFLEMLGVNSAEESSTTNYSATIAKNLKAGEIRNFSASFRFPPSYKNPSIKYDLDCN